MDPTQERVAATVIEVLSDTNRNADKAWRVIEEASNDLGAIGSEKHLEDAFKMGFILATNHTAGSVMSLFSDKYLSFQLQNLLKDFQCQT